MPNISAQLGTVPASPRLDIPADVAREVLLRVHSPVDILSLGGTSQLFTHVSRERPIWIAAVIFTRDAQQLVIPDSAIERMSIAELENTALQPYRVFAQLKAADMVLKEAVSPRLRHTELALLNQGSGPGDRRKERCFALVVVPGGRYFAQGTHTVDAEMGRDVTLGNRVPSGCGI